MFSQPSVDTCKLAQKTPVKHRDGGNPERQTDTAAKNTELITLKTENNRLFSSIFIIRKFSADPIGPNFSFAQNLYFFYMKTL